MTHVNDERTDEYLDDQDAAADWTPENIYDQTPIRMWWRGLMTYDEYKANAARVETLRAAYHEWSDREAQRILTEMGW